MAVTGLLLNKATTDHPVLSPLGNSFSISATFQNRNKENYLVYGFLPYWTLEESKYLQFDKLTDISYFALQINKDGTFTTTVEDGTSEPGYNTWRNSETLKKLINDAKNAGVRIGLTIISHENEITNAFLDCPQCWNTFLTNLYTEMDYHGVKSLNLNFEYVGDADKSAADKYTNFVKLVYTSVKRRYGEQAFVVVSTFADSTVKPRITNIADLSGITDAMFIMAYDFHQPESDNAGPVAPMEGGDYNLKLMLKDYLSNVPANKLIVGVPYYGYNWVVNSRASQAERIPGNDLIGHSQSQAYSDILETILNLRIKTNWDDLAKTPYFTYVSPETNQTRQVYFENAESLKIKYAFIKENGLRGAGIWALGYDGGYTDLWNLLYDEFFKQ